MIVTARLSSRARMRGPARAALFALVTHGLVITASLVPGWRSQPTVVGDTFSYLKPAAALVAHGSYSRDDEPPFRWEAYRTPGYPLVLAASLRLFGRPEPALYVTALTAAAAAWAAFVLAAAWCGPRAGTIAALGVALLPNSLGLSTFLLTDALAGHLALVALLLVWRAFAGVGSRRGVAAAAVAIAGLQLVKPTFAIAPVLLICAAVVARGRARRVAVVLAVAATIVPLALAARTFRDHGVFAPTFQEAKTLRYFLQAEHAARAAGVPHRAARAELVRQEQEAVPAEPLATFDARLYAYRYAHFFESAKGDPSGFAVVAAKEVVRQLVAPQEFLWLAFSSDAPAAARAVGSGLSLLLLVAAVAGTRAIWRAQRRTALAIWMTFMVLLALGATSKFVGARLRLPGDMLLVPLAACGVARAPRRSTAPHAG